MGRGGGKNAESSRMKFVKSRWSGRYYLDTTCVCDVGDGGTKSKLLHKTPCQSTEEKEQIEDHQDEQDNKGERVLYFKWRVKRSIDNLAKRLHGNGVTSCIFAGILFFIRSAIVRAVAGCENRFSVFFMSIVIKCGNGTRN